MILKYLVFTVILKLFLVSCDNQYGSLTFIIDTTYSMNKEIQSVKEAAGDIMKIILSTGSSQVNDVVLVKFNDFNCPVGDLDVSTKVILKESNNTSEVETALKNLLVINGCDCPEYSLSGIKLGLAESKRNSYLFVFTDAPPKDGHVFIGNRWYPNETNLKKELADVIKLAQSRGSPIFFFLTTPNQLCRPYLPKAYKTYQKIATATNGQVFTLLKKDDVKQLLPFLKAIISGSVDTINRVVIAADQWGTVPFSVDDYTKYVIISASSSGNDEVKLDLTETLTASSTHRIAWSDNNKVLQINNPDPGKYEVKVRGSSETTVMIFGRTDFNFQHGFSESIPPTFRNDKQQPTDGLKSHLLIKVNDPTQSVDIKTLQISSVDGSTVYHSLPLTKQSKNYYSTESFLPPDPQSIFLITVIGEGKITHKEIRRTAKTPIQARPRDTDPEISIQGGGTYEYVGDFQGNP